MSRPGRSGGNADYNLRILWPLARWLEDHHGAEVLARVARSVDLGPEDLDGGHRWVAADTFEKLLRAAREFAAGDDEFKRACAYRIREAYGPLRYILWATSPATVLEQAISNLRLVTAIGEGDLVRLGRNAVQVRIRGSVWAADLSRAPGPIGGAPDDVGTPPGPCPRAGLCGAR